MPTDCDWCETAYAIAARCLSVRRVRSNLPSTSLKAGPPAEPPVRRWLHPTGLPRCLPVLILRDGVHARLRLREQGLGDVLELTDGLLGEHAYEPGNGGEADGIQGAGRGALEKPAAEDEVEEEPEGPANERQEEVTWRPSSR